MLYSRLYYICTVLKETSPHKNHYQNLPFDLNE